MLDDLNALPPGSTTTFPSCHPRVVQHASIDFRDELPRHPTGKLYKQLLKDEYWGAAERSI